MYSEFKLPFWIQTRPETVRASRFEKLREIGLLRVAFGVEHVNEAFRERILNRKVKNEKIIESLRIVTDMGIPISVNNIMGFPTETRDLVFDTIELNRHFDSMVANAYSFTPFHGIPLRKLAEDSGLVESTLSRSIMEPTMLDMPQFPEKPLKVYDVVLSPCQNAKIGWSEIKGAEALTPKGDELFHSLKDECRNHYMNYGTVKEEDVEKVEFARDISPVSLGFDITSQDQSEGIPLADLILIYYLG